MSVFSQFDIGERDSFACARWVGIWEWSWFKPQPFELGSAGVAFVTGAVEFEMSLFLSNRLDVAVRD